MATGELDLVVIFKALADGNRLKILGLLARQPYSGEELAAILGIKPSTVSHHLSRLAAADLVSARVEGYYNIYQVNESTLKQAARLFSRVDLLSLDESIHLDAYDRKVVQDFTRRDGSLKQIPAQRKKLEAVLRYIVEAFQPDKRYSEKQLNEILSRFHQDTASLRRELVAAKLMDRQVDGGLYWRV